MSNATNMIAMPPAPNRRVTVATAFKYVNENLSVWELISLISLLSEEVEKQSQDMMKETLR